MNHSPLLLRHLRGEYDWELALTDNSSSVATLLSKTQKWILLRNTKRIISDDFDSWLTDFAWLKKTTALPLRWAGIWLILMVAWSSTVSNPRGVVKRQSYLCILFALRRYQSSWPFLFRGYLYFSFSLSFWLLRMICRLSLVIWGMSIYLPLCYSTISWVEIL